MKPYLKKIIFLSSLFLCLCILPQGVNAQPGDPGDDVDLPLDGGISVLIAAGVGYGIKKVRDERKKRANQIL